MSAAGRRIVWSPSLTVESPIVHWPNREREYEVPRPDGSVLLQHRTYCGLQVIDQAHRPANQLHPTSYSFWGVHLFARHAHGLGARWCGRCWPDGSRWWPPLQAPSG